MSGFSADLDPDDPRVLRLSGELDLAAVDAFLDAARAALDGADGALRMDVGEVNFIDSTGLGALVRLREDAHARGKDIELVDVPRQMGRILELTGLSALFGDQPAD